MDAIIAQGAEAGGHRGTFSGVDISMQPGLFALLPQVIDAVSVPVIAAGGVADGRAAAFMLGASAVQLGTAFLRCEEANVPDAHRAALREANDACTIVTDMLTGWPARYIRNGLADDLIASGPEPVSFPAQLSLTAPLQATGDKELTLLLAGQSAALAKDTNAAALVDPLPRKRRAVCRHSALDHLRLPERYDLVVDVVSDVGAPQGNAGPAAPVTGDLLLVHSELRFVGGDGCNGQA